MPASVAPGSSQTSLGLGKPIGMMESDVDDFDDERAGLGWELPAGSAPTSGTFAEGELRTVSSGFLAVASSSNSSSSRRISATGELPLAARPPP